jgi:Family of unknown function (DUF5872)
MAEGFVPPQAVRNNAKRGLELRREHGRGGTEVGVARARTLSNGQSIPLESIRRMVSYFARHEVDKKGEGWGVDSAGYIAWLLWGGDAGRTWANGISEREKKKDKSNMSNLTTAFFNIIKADRNADGTLMVYGKATDDSVDIDQQICDDVWLDSAMPEWFKTGGNIREQHSQIAAGVAKEYEKKGDGHYILTQVVDPISVKKVEMGVLKGFSIGIKNPRVVRDTKAANGRIVDGQIVEVSLVDRPANPNCQLVLAKSVDGEKGMWKVEELIEKEEKPDYESINTGGEGSEPADKELYNRVKNEAKAKFDVYPSAVANAWVVREYKSRGGTYRKKTKTVETAKGEKMEHMEEDKAVSEKPSKEDMLKQYGEAKSSYMMAKEALDNCKNMCKEMGIDIDDEDMEKQYGESAEEETAEGRAGAGAEHELEEARGKKSSEAHKCLECGCGDVGNTHGKETITDSANVGMPSNVSTAQIVTPNQTPKSAEGEEPVVEETETPAEETKEDSEEEISADVEAIVEKAVKSATESIRTEIASLVSAKEAVEAKAVSLETELAKAKSLVAGGGPKRTHKPADASNDLTTKANVYLAKANASTDPLLAKGYKELAKEFLAKATNPDAN